LLDSSWRIFSPGFFWELSSDWLCASCQHSSRWSISHELTSSWNIHFKYVQSSTFMELSGHPDMDLIPCSKRLIVVCSMFFLHKFLSACQIRLWKEMHWGSMFVGSRAAAGNPKIQGVSHGFPSSSPHRQWGSMLPANKTKKHTRQEVLISFPLFRICLSSSPFGQIC
jgi:hypothetical protein